MKNLFQLLDVDGEQFGLIQTDCDELTVETMWSDYYNEQLDLPKGELDQIYEDEEVSADGFAGYLRLEGFKAKRVYTVELNP